IGRSYKAGNRWVGLAGLSPIQFDHTAIVAKFQKLQVALRSAAEKLDAGPKSQLEAAIMNVATAISKDDIPLNWAVASKLPLAALKQAVSATGAVLALGESETQLATELEELADKIAVDDKAHLEARK